MRTNEHQMALITSERVPAGANEGHRQQEQGGDRVVLRWEEGDQRCTECAFARPLSRVLSLAPPAARPMPVLPAAAHAARCPCRTCRRRRHLPPAEMPPCGRTQSSRPSRSGSGTSPPTTRSMHTPVSYTWSLPEALTRPSFCCTPPLAFARCFNRDKHGGVINMGVSFCCTPLYL